MTPNKPIPVILDTDIGGDIDDTWALAMLLKSPELDLKLVTTCHGHTPYRAKITAKLLEVAGRTDVGVGVGIQTDNKELRQAPWVTDYKLESYPGRMHKDGVSAMIDAIMGSPEPVTLIAIGPAMNVAAALKKEPRIAEKARLVGMFGNVRTGFGDSAVPIPEYNVKVDVPASKAVFTAPWDITITPLDTCGRIVLKDEKYFKVRDCKDPVIRALIENYRYWHVGAGYKPLDFADVSKSSILFDTVAVYLAFASGLLNMEDLEIVIEDDGLTAVRKGGKIVHTAVSWKDMAGFEDFLVKRLIGEPGV
jgi:inosine-uridine nucleoside N-ribohydrolase